MSSKTRNAKKRSLARQSGERCAICLVPMPLARLTLDHVIPRAQGGPDALWNLRLACSPCNHGRHHGPRR